MNTKQWFDKIEWDKNQNKEDYKFSYINFGEEVIVNFDSIIYRDNFSFRINQNGSLADIPYHRVRKIFKKDKIVFSRRNNLRGE